MSRRRQNSNNDQNYIIAFVLICICLFGSLIKIILENIIYILIAAVIIGAGSAALMVTVKLIKAKTKQQSKEKPKETPTDFHVSINDTQNNIVKETSSEPKLEQPSNPKELIKEINEYSGKYVATELLTYNELNFYRSLKPIADKLGLSIIAKVRMADLVKPTANYHYDRSEYMSYFGKIKSKHIDFVLCDPVNLKIKLLIELDDSSHENTQTMERDDFVEKVYQDTGYKLLRTYTNWNLEKNIKHILGISE